MSDGTPSGPTGPDLAMCAHPTMVLPSVVSACKGHRVQSPSSIHDTDFGGLWIPLVTPFRGGAVDHPALAALARRLAGQGIAGFVVCGSTGEAAALDEAERARSIAEHAAGEAMRDAQLARDELVAHQRDSSLELEAARLRQRLADRDRLAAELADRAAKLELTLRDADARLRAALDDNVRVHIIHHLASRLAACCFEFCCFLAVSWRLIACLLMTGG